MVIPNYSPIFFVDFRSSITSDFESYRVIKKITIAIVFFINTSVLTKRNKSYLPETDKPSIADFFILKEMIDLRLDLLFLLITLMLMINNILCKRLQNNVLNCCAKRTMVVFLGCAKYRIRNLGFVLQCLGVLFSHPTDNQIPKSTFESKDRKCSQRKYARIQRALCNRDTEHRICSQSYPHSM